MLFRQAYASLPISVIRGSVVKSFQGFRYQTELIDVADEQTLIARVRELPFEHFDFHGYKGKRRVVSFAWRYDYSGRGLQRAPRTLRLVSQHPPRRFASLFDHVQTRVEVPRRCLKLLVS